MGWLLKSLNNTSADAFAAQDVNSASFKQGLTPEYVRKLTQFLKDNGYDQEVTDTYDDAVKSNLIQFQSDHYNSNAENYVKRKKMVNYVDIALNTNPLYNLAKLNPVVRTTIDYMAGRNPVVTEKDLNKNSQEFLGKVIANQLDSNYYDNQTFGPANYPKKRYHKNPLSSGFNVSYLVGRGNFEKDGDSYIITDNFDPGSNAGKHGFFGKIENAINAFTGKREPIRTEIVIPEEMVETHQDGGIMKYQNPSDVITNSSVEAEFPSWKEYRNAQASKVAESAISNMLNLNAPLIPPHEEGQTPHTCIYTISGMYGPESQEQNNIKFRANPRKYGFKKTNDAEIGDVIQLSKMPESKDIMRLRWPHHMVMVTDVQDNGELGVSYSNGGMDDDDLRKNKYNLHQKGKYGFGDWTRQQPYEFIGTKNQRKAWRKDYNNLKNKK